MLQRDYIMRLIQLFFEALAKFLRNKENQKPDVLRSELDELYKTFLKYPRDHFKAMSIDEIINSFNDEGKLYKLEIVAELFYQDALLGEVDKLLLEKSLALFRYVDLNGDVFSFDRNRKVGEIEEILSQF
ncbi:hypothetical protein [Bacteroides sp. 51]|uniref:hypothetical protein n=1 Tax=Bacteroides sp. 51 TaxID=2302938 RepID=UPI0013CF61A7|nr:hypothetical protein [Bacteroides sp. 51]NDV82510.1 hypothetical protein [Bacteroides sp. 51]